MENQFPNSHRERVFVKVSFVAFLVREEEQLLILVLLLSLGHVHFEGLDRTNGPILRRVQSYRIYLCTSRMFVPVFILKVGGAAYAWG